MRKVKVSNLKAGKTIYIASAKFGIEKHLVTSLPYQVKLEFLTNVTSTPTFIKTRKYSRGIPGIIDPFIFNSHISLKDSGVIPNSYNDRKTFFKLKQAEAWVAR